MQLDQKSDCWLSFKGFLFISLLVWLTVATARAESLGSNTATSTTASQSAMLVAERIRVAFEPSNRFLIKVVIAERQTQSPFVAIVTAQGNCIVVINSKPESWSAWAAFRAQGKLGEAESYYFALLHELGHCVNKLNTVPGSRQFAEGYDSEFYADVFALVAAKNLLDSDSFKTMAEGVVKARIAQTRWFSPKTHSTGRSLQSAYQLLSSSNENIGLDSAGIGQLSLDLVEQLNAVSSPLALSSKLGG